MMRIRAIVGGYYLQYQTFSQIIFLAFLLNILKSKSAEEYRIFYSGPNNLISKINSAAKKLKIKFYNNTI